METKTKNEKIIFWGFVFLAIAFLGMIYYFYVQNEILENKNEILVKKEQELKLKEIALEETNLKSQNAFNEIKVLNPKLINEINAIEKQTSQAIKADITKAAINQGLTKSVIYVQVGSNESTLNLKNKDFISKLNSIGYNIMSDYDLEEGKADNSIRYFNKEDKDLSEKLKKDIEKEFPDIVLTPKLVSLKTKVPVGQIEIWVK